MLNNYTKPPRVLMAVPQYPYPVTGGLERQAHELAKALLELGLSVQAVSGTIFSGQAAQEWVEGVKVHRVPWSRRKWARHIRTPFDLLRVLHAQRHTYDLVHLHQFSGFGLFVILAARLLGKPVLTKLPNVGLYGLPGMASSPLGALRVAIFKQSDAVVALSRESINELAEIGFPLCRVLATPNGICTLPHGDASSRDRADPGACRVVFVGRLSEEKRIEDLLHAWRRVVASTSTAVRLELWGSGPLGPVLNRMRRDLDIEDSVFLKGHVDSVRDKLKDMDVFVLPSMAEGNSNAILEAMAAGLPIVSTRVGGTPILVGAEGAHFLVDPGDREGLYSRLMELVEDEDLRKRVGDVMRRRILDHFDMKRVAETYAAAYDRLAADRRDRVCEISNPVVAAG